MAAGAGFVDVFPPLAGVYFGADFLAAAFGADFFATGFAGFFAAAVFVAGFLAAAAFFLVA